MNKTDTLKPLVGVKVVTLALNVPGPITCNKLANMGAEVVKIEPPSGDPLTLYAADWYQLLNHNQTVLMCDLKSEDGINHLFEILQNTDVLITAQRVSGLDRLGLSWDVLQQKFPKLSHVAIVGHGGEMADKAGHDLTYMANFGLLSPPQMPKTLMADLAGAEKAVSATLAVQMLQSQHGQGRFVEIALDEAAAEFAQPLNFGLTEKGGLLSGVNPEYSLYNTANGWLAVAALEPHFKKRLIQKLDLTELTKENLAEKLMQRTAKEWERWGETEDIPLSAVLG